MKILIETIPHKHQRYETCGDWQFDPARDTLVIRVSALGDWRQEGLIAIHELVESLLAKDRNISEKLVDEFDMAFEAARQPGNNDEPGNDPACPVYKEHQVATIIERLLCHEFGINWKEYDDAVESLS